MNLTRLVFWGLFAFIVASVGWLTKAQSNVSPSRNEQAELDVLTEVNRWRIRTGNAPLAQNADLDALALGQALYKVAEALFTTAPVDFHVDLYGNGVSRRAEIYGWPGYDSPERVVVGEIAAY